jgi:AraC family transcriptional regulator of adaptative response / DNA-3-methyladenine glycosylase II
MELSAEACYRAIVSRDRRFDGRFFVAVTTTGVYCRPGCPAPAPRPSHVRFYACAAAAEVDGFRACLRCRPDRAPGVPTWNGTSATVSRALRLIGDGALDGEGSVAQLAGRLGVGERHLRRLFLAHLGASPQRVAHTRRLHFARALLDDTALAIAQVAHAAGFGSIRRFNDAMRAAFGRTPSALRAARRDGSGAPGTLTLRLSYRPPFDFAGLSRFLGARAIPGLEQVENGVYQRAIPTRSGAGGWIALAHLPGEPAVRLQVHGEPAPSLIDVVERARRLLDLRADPAAIARVLRRDPRLASLLRQAPDLRLPGAWDGFELAVRAVVGQQVSVAAARTLLARLIERFGPPPASGAPAALSRCFPTPAALADAPLATIGMPGMRARALGQLAAAVRDGELLLDGTRPLVDTVARLRAIAGIGPWTAEYIAMRALDEPDALPAGDLGLRRALGQNGELAQPAAVLAEAERWRPFRAYAALLLWRR